MKFQDSNEWRQLLQAALDSARRGAVFRLIITLSSVLEVHMVFENMAIIEKVFQSITLTSACFYLNENLFGCTALKISKAWMALTKGADFAPLANLDWLYILFNSEETISSTERTGKNFAFCE